MVHGTNNYSKYNTVDHFNLIIYHTYKTTVHIMYIHTYFITFSIHFTLV